MIVQLQLDTVDPSSQFVLPEVPKIVITVSRGSMDRIGNQPLKIDDPVEIGNGFGTASSNSSHICFFVLSVPNNHFLVPPNCPFLLAVVCHFFPQTFPNFGAIYHFSTLCRPSPPPSPSPPSSSCLVSLVRPYSPGTGSAGQIEFGQLWGLGECFIAALGFVHSFVIFAGPGVCVSLLLLPMESKILGRRKEKKFGDNPRKVKFQWILECPTHLPSVFL